MAGRRGRVGRLFLSNRQGSLSGKMTFKIKQRSGGMISVEETASTKDVRREHQAVFNHYNLNKH